MKTVNIDGNRGGDEGMTDRCYGCAHLFYNTDSFHCITYFCKKFRKIVGKDDGDPNENPPKPLEDGCKEEVTNTPSEAEEMWEELRSELDYYQTFARQHGERAAWFAACDNLIKLRSELERIAELLPDWKPGKGVAFLATQRIQHLEGVVNRLSAIKKAAKDLLNLLPPLPFPPPFDGAEIGNAVLELEDALEE